MTEHSNNIKELSPEYICMYYKHQYDRMSILEGQRLSVTNIIITISALAYTFGFANIKTFDIINRVILLVLIILFNLFAIAYIARCSDHETIHQKRAAKILEKYAPALLHLNKEIPWAKQGILGGRVRIQKIIHIGIIITALVPLVVFLLATFIK